VLPVSSHQSFAQAMASSSNHIKPHRPMQRPESYFIREGGAIPDSFNRDQTAKIVAIATDKNSSDEQLSDAFVALVEFCEPSDERKEFLFQSRFDLVEKLKHMLKTKKDPIDWETDFFYNGLRLLWWCLWAQKNTPIFLNDESNVLFDLLPIASVVNRSQIPALGAIGGMSVVHGNDRYIARNPCFQRLFLLLFFFALLPPVASLLQALYCCVSFIYSIN
jgi:hypothetical protein